MLVFSALGQAAPLLVAIGGFMVWANYFAKKHFREARYGMRVDARWRRTPEDVAWHDFWQNDPEAVAYVLAQEEAV